MSAPKADTGFILTISALLITPTPHTPTQHYDIEILMRPIPKIIRVKVILYYHNWRWHFPNDNNPKSVWPNWSVLDGDPLGILEGSEPNWVNPMIYQIYACH